MDNQPLRLPIRGLAEFLLRRGDIDAAGVNPDRAAEGARIHRQLQKRFRQQYGDAYQSEVSLSIQVEDEPFCYQLEGRADGILEEEGRLTVDEIKTTLQPLEDMTEDSVPAHWAQAACYGFILSRQRDCPEVTLRLLYYQVETQEERAFLRTLTRQQLEQQVRQLLEQYRPWAALQRDWNAQRTASIQALRFPFGDYRPGQRQMATAVYRTIQRGGRLYCQAPTGIGKTISALFPAVKSMGEGLTQRIFFLTARTIGRQAALQAYDALSGQGLFLRCLTLTAKDKVCFLEERSCNPQDCPWAKGYYDRINPALLELLNGPPDLTRERLEQHARQHRLCPFELALDASLFCDLIIGDYNYLFDPVVNLHRLMDAQSRSVFLVDEAHNLVDRAREMYTAMLEKSAFLTLKKQIPSTQRALRRALDQVSRGFLPLREAAAQQDGRALVLEDLEPDSPEAAAWQELDSRLEKLDRKMTVWLEEHRGQTPPEGFLPLFFSLRFYLRIRELADEGYRHVCSASGSNAKVRLLCLDPSPQVDRCLRQGRAAVFFSATLTPSEYYISVLGGLPAPEPGPKDPPVLRCVLPSPYPQENLGIFIAHRVSTRYQHREKSLPQLVQLLLTFCTAKPGNYLICFPSYHYLQQGLEALRPLLPDDCTILVQQPSMSEEEREDFLEQFQPGGRVLAFCVLGGLFTEGIDLRGDRLIGAAIVGVGLPQISRELDLLRRYYDQRPGRPPEGFAFAYQYPGMNRVQQAGGRVIRSEQDKGAILLVDDRFLLPEYRRLLPEHWSHQTVVNHSEALRQALEIFWGR